MTRITWNMFGAVLLVLGVLSAVLPSLTRAQGESAVPFLLIAPNSRAAGIGEAGTGTVDDASAIFWNPGALAFLEGSRGRRSALRTPTGFRSSSSRTCSTTT
jgi:hypothetical protein